MSEKDVKVGGLKPDDAKKRGNAFLLGASTQGAVMLILLQIASRALTFLVNQVIIRFLSPSAIGISSQLELFATTVLFLARETVRVVAQRRSLSAPSASSADGSKAKQDAGGLDADSEAGHLQTVINLSHVSTVLGPPLLLITGGLYLNRSADETRQILYFRESLYIYALGIMAELVAEPCFIVLQHKMLYKPRARAESAGSVARCIITCAIVIFGYRYGVNLGALPFALGYLGYALALAGVYFTAYLDAVAAEPGVSLTGKTLAKKDSNRFHWGYFSRDLVSLGVSMTLQSAIKFVLTQADAFSMAVFTTLEDQGVFTVAANYGGLVARLLFQPVEEASRNLFSKLLAQDSQKSTNVEKDNVIAAEAVLTDVLRGYMIFSIFPITLGPFLAPLLLRIVAGQRWDDAGAGTVLGAYCPYIPLLAVNGILEAFVASVATASQLRQQSVWMFLFSAVFVGSSFAASRVFHLGAVGVVWANGITMFCRVLWSTNYVQRYFRVYGDSLKLERLTPTVAEITASVAASATLYQLKLGSGPLLHDLVKGGLVAVTLAAVVLYSERTFIRRLLASRRKG